MAQECLSSLLHISIKKQILVESKQTRKRITQDIKRICTKTKKFAIYAYMK